jgi:hypothetical protein
MEKSDPFAYGGLVNEPDAHLFELIAEYRRRWAEANERDISDDERAARCDHADEISEQIKPIRPATLRGVLAALDFAAEIEDWEYWPEGAIEGLRAIVDREARP